jgi:hypothetical protein
MKLFQAFGISEMPWMMRVYLLVFFALLLMMCVAGLNIRLGGFEGTINAKLFAISAESLKVVVGAMLGALSMAARQEWGASTKPKEVEPDASGDG